MDASKLTPGAIVAAIGGVVLLILLFFVNWYNLEVVRDIGNVFGVSTPNADFGAWDGEGFLGTIANLIILAAGVVAIGGAVMVAMGQTARQNQISALTAAGGIAAVALVFLRMLFQPGPNEAVGLDIGIWIALIAAAVVAVGGFMMMNEAGTSFTEARDQFQSGRGSGPGQSPPPPGQPPQQPPPPQGGQQPPGGPPQQG